VLGTTFSTQPDFAKLAESCGCHGENVVERRDIEAALTRAKAANERGQPAVVSFKVGKDRLRNTLEYFPFYNAAS
jgi:thiamine pyrophosphate-dependent acetolactate synthase large subunit-like protein